MQPSHSHAVSTQEPGDPSDRTAAPVRAVAQRAPGDVVTRFAAPGAAIVLALVLWQVTVSVGLLDPAYFPGAAGTLQALVVTLGTGTFWAALGQTLAGAALGWLTAAAIAIPLGVLIGSSEWLYRAFRVPIEFLRPMPSVAVIPAAVLILGTGMESKIFLAAFAAFWPMLVQTIYGMHDTDVVAVETAKSFRLRTVDRVWRIKLPAALPFIVTGVRISVTVALILAVTAELLIGAPGLGRELNLARSSGAIELMYALIIVSGLLGWALNTATRAAESRLLGWHHSSRESLA